MSGTTIFSFLPVVVLGVIAWAVMASFARKPDDWKKGAPELKPPPRRGTRMPGADVSPGMDRGRGEGVAFHRGFHLTYLDAKAEISERRVTARKLRQWGDSDIAMHAWCHERGALRTFLATRMQQLVDIETGEIFEPPHGWLRSQFPNLAPTPIAAPLERDLQTRIQVGQMAVLILIYIAKADGRMMARERAEIFAFSTALKLEHNIDLKFSGPDDDRIKRLRCDHEEFLLAVNGMKSQVPALKAALLAAAKAVVHADGVVKGAEADAYDWLSRAIG